MEAMPRSNFDLEVEREMRAIEANIRNMLADDPALASVVDRTPGHNASDVATKYHLSQNNYRFNDPNQYNYPPHNYPSQRPKDNDNLSYQGTNSNNPYRPPPQALALGRGVPGMALPDSVARNLQNSPPRRKGLNNLYETDENLRLRAEKQAAYSQQLQQQVRYTPF